MPVYRVTPMFNQSVMGWSETYYTRGNVSPSSMATQITTLMDQRTSIMWSNQEVVGIRIADLGTSPGPLLTKRKSVFFTPGNWPFPGTNSVMTIPHRGKNLLSGVLTGSHPDQVRAALHMRLTYGGGFNTIRYLVGFPDIDSHTEPGNLNFNGDPSWLPKWLAFIGHLSSVWAIRARTPISVDPKVPVENLVTQESAPSLLGVVVDAATSPSYSTGTKIHLEGFRPRDRGHISLNGKYYVASVNTTLMAGKRIYYLRGVSGQVPDDWKILGTVQKVDYGIYPIEGIEPIRIGIHKRGRPSAAPRGRRLTRTTLDP